MTAPKLDLLGDAARSPSHAHRFLLCLGLGLCGLVMASGAHHPIASNQRLAYLADFERAVLASAREVAPSLPRQFVNFVSAAEQEYARHDGTTAAYVRFPVNQFRLVHRFALDWPAWRKDLKENGSACPNTTCSRFLSRFTALSDSHLEIDKFPEEDLSIAAHAITLLQLFYREKAGLVPSGRTDDQPTLTALEMLKVAAITFTANLEDYSQTAARLWVKLALEQVARYCPYCPPARVIDYIVSHRDRYGCPGRLAFNHEERIAVDTIGEDLQRNPRRLEAFIEFIENDNDTTICRHAADRSNGSFHCFYFHSPHFRYAPFKFEIVSRWPYIALVHNFMSESTASAFIRVSTLNTSYVTPVYYENEIIEDDLLTRLGETTVVPLEDPLSKWLDLRVRYATLLMPNSQANGVIDGEPAQIINYGLGGRFQEHYDFMNADEDDIFLTGIHKLGNRLATVLIYLSDVATGGNTAFLELGVSVVPRVGKAVVWFNMDPMTGDLDYLTRHAACPVNAGSKWVLTKWIRDHKKTGHSRPLFS